MNEGLSHVAQRCTGCQNMKSTPDSSMSFPFIKARIILNPILITPDAVAYYACGPWALMASVWSAGQQIAQSAASDGAPANVAVNEEEVRGPHASLAVRLQVESYLHPNTGMLCLLRSCQGCMCGYGCEVLLLHMITSDAWFINCLCVLVFTH